MIYIIDFGSQSTHLISRRLREISIESKIILPENTLAAIEDIKPAGIILSGGPASVYEKNAPLVDQRIFELGIPVLGICYGEQLIAHLLGGEVKPGKVKEYGPATLTLTKQNPLFNFNITENAQQQTETLHTTRYPLHELSVWMSHGDEVIAPPPNFITYGHTDTIKHAVIADEAKQIFGIQFHPEVVHTQFGLQILSQFALICGQNPKPAAITQSFIEDIIQDVKDSIGDKTVIGAFSGGVDSTIACLLVHKAIGDAFTAIYIDSGLMREGETEELQKVFQKEYHMNIRVVHAADRFLSALAGITDPEKKRKAIGRTFIEVLDDEATKLNATFLVQGTIYPDVIESAGTKHSKNIKSHHNVGGLPKDMKLTLLEPLRNLYKDEVRKIGQLMNLPREITHRHPFPGPGLAIRIIGEVTDDKLQTLRKADKIVQEVAKEANITHGLWQIFAVFTGIKTTGVRGDDRAYGDTIAIRAVEAIDVMSGNFAHLPLDLLQEMSIRIVTEIPTVNRVLYDITNKPPATIEWE